MEITFLGTSSGVPTRSRNVSSVALRLPQRAEVWLFDCGEGTQHQLLRSDIKSSQLQRIFITHMHGDHIFGLMGLLASCGLAGSAQSVDIYGPPGLDNYLRACAKYTYSHLPNRIRLHTVDPGVVYEDEEYIVTCRPLHHRVPAFGYRIAEKDRPGRFDVDRAVALGHSSRGPSTVGSSGEKPSRCPMVVASGALNCAGRLNRVEKLSTAPIPFFCEAAVELAQGADVLIHEATFSHQDAQLAFERLHSTSTMAAQVALAAGVKQLLMTHFSPRYAPGNALQLDDLLQEARAIFPNTKLAYDFFTYEVPRRRQEQELKVG